MPPRPFSRILVANRGEIAVRIIRACQEMGIETVAVYSTADKDSLHRRLADVSVCIGPPSPAESYLNIPRIISAAEVTDVEAIHPGYGFLAENSRFVEICSSSNIEFIGPSAESMNSLGDKANAREIAKRAKVPITPGSDGCIEDEEEALATAQRIGYPVMIKATAGGGGRGIRVARNDMSFRTGFAQSRQEALLAFANGEVYIEKFLANPRHIEIQIIADKHGNVATLGERDCSLQRRNQKLLEEAPSPVLAEKIRRKMCDAATRLAKEAGYHGAGTLEFLFDKDNNFYFMEMNARIQVEHPVSELVTGIDLIQEMIRVAAGEKLSMGNGYVKLQGHAIECRINAEDPERNFAPCPGTINYLLPPWGKGIRWDSHVTSGDVISPHYDSLIGKLIVHDETREKCIERTKQALDGMILAGIKTTIPVCRALLNDKNFIEGNVHTKYLEEEFLA